MEKPVLFTVRGFAVMLERVGYDMAKALHLARAAASQKGKDEMDMQEFLRAVKDIDNYEARTGRLAEE